MELMNHQRAAVEKGLANKRLAFFHDTGTGKTLVGIELAARLGLKTLIVCPLSIIECAWMQDFKRFRPEVTPIINLWKSRKNKTLNADLECMRAGVVNYETFSLMIQKGELHAADIGMIIFDESSKLKNIKAAVTKRAIKYAENIDRCYLLSGTPAPNNELEYWTQVRLVSELWGRSFYSWRSAWCYPSGYGGHQWKLKKDNRQRLLDDLLLVSDRVARDDVLDLPPRSHNIREVTLSPNERRAYKEMEHDMITELDETQITAVHAGAKLMKLREGTSGFYLDENGCTHRAEAEAAKQKALVELLEEIGGHSVIMWTHFREEARQIQSLLGDRCVRIDGSDSNQTRRYQAIKDFQSGRVQYLVAHPASLGHGVTLINCSYAVYYSLSHSLELFAQSQDRIYRYGQNASCSYYYLIASGTVDGAIYKALQRKRSVLDAVLDYLRR